MPTLRTKTGDIVLVEKLIDADTSSSITSKSVLMSPERSSRSFMASMVSGSALVKIQVSNDGDTWMDYASLSPSASTADGFADDCPWPFVRASVTSNTGVLTVTVGC
jgi:hypothetical protein